MLGDFNTGPEVLPNIEAELGENYPLFVEQGWYNENIESGDTFCTWCPEENNLISSENNSIFELKTSTIDHIVVKNAEVKNTRRIFDETLNIGPPGGPVIPVNMSDHFGVIATVIFDP